MSEMPLALYLNYGRYPHICLQEDQWGEYGWFYAPLEDCFYRYYVDRKEQSDGIEARVPREEFLTRELPENVRSWAEGFAVLPTPEAVYVYFAGRDQLRCFARELVPDEKGHPRVVVENLDPAAQTDVLGDWLAPLRAQRR